MKKLVICVLAFFLIVGLLPYSTLSVNAVPGDTYTLRFNANGGNWTNWPQPAEEILECDDPYTLPTNVPARPGFTFDGWYDILGNPYTPGDTVYGNTYNDGDIVTLYASWVQTPRFYTINYNANGGNDAPWLQTKQEGQSLTLSTQVPTRGNNYNFLYWSTNANGAGVQYYPSDLYTDDKDITLYAIWGQGSNYYVVNYNANGGSVVPAPQTKQHGVSLTLSSTTPTRSGGFTFLGWANDPTATNPQYIPGDSYTANANITLYAIWLSDGTPSYTVSYNANGGNGAPASQTKIQDVALTLSNTVPTRSGYNFLGWSTNASATSAQYQAGGTITANTNENITLFAVWERNPSSSGSSSDNSDVYIIIYDANGGRGEPTSQTKTYDKPLVLSNRQPTRSGYIFDGWSYNRRSTRADFWPGGVYRYNEDAVLYAIWVPDDMDYRYSDNRPIDRDYIPVSYSSPTGTSSTLPKTGSRFSTIPLAVASSSFLLIIVCILSRKAIKRLFSR